MFRLSVVVPWGFTELCPCRVMEGREEADILNAFPTSGWHPTFWSHLKRWESCLYTAYMWAIEGSSNQCTVQTRKGSSQDLNFNFPVVWACIIFSQFYFFTLTWRPTSCHLACPLIQTHSKSLIPIVYLILVLIKAKRAATAENVWLTV